MPEDKESLPSFGDWLADKLGFQLPTLIPMPQARKNFDKAVGSVWASLGENLAARIKANTGKTKAKGKIEIDDLFETAEQKRKTENRAKTLGVAAEDLEKKGPKEDASSEIDDDWLNLFNRIAEDKSSEELQSLFGRILSGEIRRPGTYSLRTIQFLSTLSKKEAGIISSFMSSVINLDFVPLLQGPELGPLPAVRTLMQELGIAGSFSGVIASWNGEVLPHQVLVFAGTQLGVVVNNDTDHSIALSVPVQVVTSLGKELFHIANPPPTAVPFLESLGSRLLRDIRTAHSEDVASGRVTVLLARTTHVSGDTYHCVPIKAFS